MSFDLDKSFFNDFIVFDKPYISVIYICLKRSAENLCQCVWSYQLISGNIHNKILIRSLLISFHSFPKNVTL